MATASTPTTIARTSTTRSRRWRTVAQPAHASAPCSSQVAAPKERSPAPHSATPGADDAAADTTASATSATQALPPGTLPLGRVDATPAATIAVVATTSTSQRAGRWTYQPAGSATSGRAATSAAPMANPRRSPRPRTPGAPGGPAHPSCAGPPSASSTTRCSTGVAPVTSRPGEVPRRGGGGGAVRPGSPRLAAHRAVLRRLLPRRALVRSELLGGAHRGPEEVRPRGVVQPHEQLRRRLLEHLRG